MVCTQLVLAYNQIEAIPLFITSLNRLTTLDVSHNALLTLPRILGKCGSVTALLVDGNSITSPPPIILCMGTTAIISYLQQLCDAETNARIILARLDLTEIPMEVAELRRVTTVDMSNNQLTSIRPLNLLTRLTTLNMASNNLTDVDDDLRDRKCIAPTYTSVFSSYLKCMFETALITMLGLIEIKAWYPKPSILSLVS
jgi:internalin A